jgi:hypothetical protein
VGSIVVDQKYVTKVLQAVSGVSLLVQKFNVQRSRVWVTVLRYQSQVTATENHEPWNPEPLNRVP